jgi:hypothetical protein
MTTHQQVYVRPAAPGPLKTHPQCAQNRPSIQARRRFLPLIIGYAIAIYIDVCAMVSLILAAFVPDYTGKTFFGSYDPHVTSDACAFSKLCRQAEVDLGVIRETCPSR